ncbi:MAG: hypothetical protein H0Z35_04210 [Thermoanaerobacteraceae bacterium]|nr:hypothetical protein [Thermoanaerobacteraceae bacterium]
MQVKDFMHERQKCFVAVSEMNVQHKKVANKCAKAFKKQITVRETVYILYTNPEITQFSGKLPDERQVGTLIARVFCV